MQLPHSMIRARSLPCLLLLALCAAADSAHGQIILDTTSSGYRAWVTDVDGSHPEGMDLTYDFIDRGRLTGYRFDHYKALSIDLLTGATNELFRFVDTVNILAVDEPAGIAFTDRASIGNSNIELIRHDFGPGGHQVTVLLTTRDLIAIVLNPGSQTVYLLNNDDLGRSELWRVNYDGTGLTRLAVYGSTWVWENDLKFVPENQKLFIADVGASRPAMLNLDGTVAVSADFTIPYPYKIARADYDPHQETVYWLQHPNGSRTYGEVYRRAMVGDAAPELLVTNTINDQHHGTRLFLLPDYDNDSLGSWREAEWGTSDADLDSDDDGLSDSVEINESREHRWVSALSGAETHFYTVSLSTNWIDAAAEARALGGYLYSIGDSMENTSVIDAIYSIQRYTQQYGPKLIGLSRSSSNAPWLWDSGEDVSYWHNGTPASQDRYAFVDIVNGSQNYEWYFKSSDTGLAILECPWQPILSPVNPDSDGDGIQDGTERGVTSGILGSPGSGILGTDLRIFVPDSDPLTTTSPLDADSDEDGLIDGYEDRNGSGSVDLGELDPLAIDTDLDLLQDGTESSVVVPHAATSRRLFQPDVDPATSTNPLERDTDGGGLWDGYEDLNSDGAFVFWEFDPLSAGDDRFLMTSPGLFRGQTSLLTLSGFRAGSDLTVAASGRGLGTTNPIPGLILDILPPFRLTQTSRWYSTTATIPMYVAAGVPAGTSVWLQAVERISSLSAYRTSIVVAETVH